MYSKRDIGMLIAGAQLFHTLVHIMLSLAGVLPLHFFFVTLTDELNIVAIVINGLISVALLQWASKLKK